MILVEEPEAPSPLSSVPDTCPSSQIPTKLPALENISISSTAAKDRESMAPRPKKPKVAPKRTPKKPKWDADDILIDSKSPLATADLRSVLSDSLAWDALSKEEKAEIIALFPDDEHILRGVNGGDEACLNLGTLLNDDSFRRDCAAYTRDIADGKHDPEWLAQAWSAHERRKMGDFDAFLVKEFEKAWDVQLPENFKPRRDLTSAAITAPLTAEGSTSSKQSEIVGQTGDAQEEQAQGITQKDEKHMDVDEVHTEDARTLNASPKAEEVVDELQADQEEHQPEDARPPKRQKQSSAKPPGSDDELA